MVDIEDDIMKPLVSGAEAKRFLEPHTETYLLFPYRILPEATTLLTENEMATEFPKAWKYLKGFEKELRARESKKFDDDKWYRMGRTQNLDKQEQPKILVPRLVANLGCFVDDKGLYYCDNVDVGGVVPKNVDDIWLIAGTLNAPATNMMFNWLTKPFRGDYKSANKQFIAPLPIPKGTRTDRAGVTAVAKRLQTQSTQRLDLRAQLEDRLASAARNTLPLERLLPNVRGVADIESAIPKAVKLADRKNWVDAERSVDEEAAYARIDGMIRPDSALSAALVAGKLSFLIDEQEAARLFVDDAEAALVAAQWACIALDFAVSGRGDGKRLIDRLRKIATSAEPAVAAQIIAIGAELAILSQALRGDEAQLHEITCRMFALTPAERRLVELSRGRG